MSHFTVGVVVPKDTPKSEIKDYLDNIMAPYDEELTVPEYKMKCWCVGQKATSQINHEVELFLGPIEKVRADYWKRHEGEEDSEERQIAMNKEWDNLVAPRKKYFADSMEDHPLREAADPECDECKGTGMRSTDRNPRSRWDWWCIGGRWCGTITKTEMPDDGEGGFNFGDNYHGLNENSATVATALANDFVPFALILPDGIWHEKGEMGMFAMVSNEKKEGDWDEKVRTVLQPFKDDLMVQLDVHI
jgi:hypothetical protein